TRSSPPRSPIDMSENVPDAHKEPREEAAAASAETDAKLAELEDRWLRAVADLDNLRKRISRDNERLRAEERARVAAAWLPVLDHLELSLSHASRGAAPKAVLDGVRALRAKAVAVMPSLGYPRNAETGVI